jgi:hypothetical protein
MIGNWGAVRAKFKISQLMDLKTLSFNLWNINIFILALSFILIILSKGHNKDEKRYSLSSLAFLFIVIATVWGLLPFGDSYEIDHFGMVGSRFYLIIVSVIPCAIWLIIKMGNYIMLVLFSFLFLTAFLSYGEFYLSYKSRFVTIGKLSDQYDNAINNYLKKDPSNIVITECLGWPERGAILSGFSCYRTKKGMERIHKWTLNGGRIFWTNSFVVDSIPGLIPPKRKALYLAADGSVSVRYTKEQ